MQSTKSAQSLELVLKHSLDKLHSAQYLQRCGAWIKKVASAAGDKYKVAGQPCYDISNYLINALNTDKTSTHESDALLYHSFNGNLVSVIMTFDSLTSCFTGEMYLENILNIHICTHFLCLLNNILAPSIDHGHIKLFLCDSGLSPKSRPDSDESGQSKASVILDFACTHKQ